MRKLLLAAAILFPLLALAIQDTGVYPENWGMNSQGMSTYTVTTSWIQLLPANAQRAFLAIQPTCSQPIALSFGAVGTATVGLQIGGGAVGTSTFQPAQPPTNAIYASALSGSCVVQIVEGIH